MFLITDYDNILINIYCQLCNSYLRNINNDAKSSVFDGINSNYSIIFGSELSDDSHLLGFIDYRNVESIRWDDRDIGVCAFRGNASCIDSQ